jgi:hypothetical protein
MLFIRMRQVLWLVSPLDARATFTHHSNNQLAHSQSRQG